MRPQGVALNHCKRSGANLSQQKNSIGIAWICVDDLGQLTLDDCALTMPRKLKICIVARLDEVEPESHFPVSRPRTVADLMAWSAWSVWFPRLDFKIWKNWKLKTTYDTIHAFGSTCSDPEANSLNDGFYGEAQAPYLNILKWIQMESNGILVVALRTQSVHVFP